MEEIVDRSPDNEYVAPSDGTMIGNLTSGLLSTVVSGSFYFKAREILTDPSYALNIGTLTIDDRINLALGTMSLATISTIYAAHRFKTVIEFFRNTNHSAVENLGTHAVRRSYSDPKPAPENPDMP